MILDERRETKDERISGMGMYKLGDLCSDVVDCPHSTPEWKNEGIRVIRNFNIVNGSLDFSNGFFVDEETFEKRTQRACPEFEDLVISREAPMGAVCMIPKNLKCCLGQRLVLLKVNKDVADPNYILFAIQSQFVQKQIQIINQTGSIVSNLNIPDLKSLRIPLPSLPEQKKIASVLSVLDDKIALNKKMNQKLEAMAKRLYDYWFVQFDFPDENGRPYKTTGGPMTYNPTLKREIPEGWEVKSLFDCSDVLYGFPYATEPFDEENLDISTKPYPVIRIRDIKDNTISAKTTEIVDDRYRTKVNDLLIGMDGYFHMSFWPRNDDYVNQRITRIRQKDLSIMVIYHQIAPFIKFKEDQAKGSTVGHLSDKDMKQINILVPNNPRLSEKFDGILNLITKNKQEISRLTALRDKLLPLLMNGQVVIE